MGFLIFPDNPAGAAAAYRKPVREEEQVLEHASGRPWIVGQWAPEDLIQVTEGPCRLALLGSTRIEVTRLRTILDRVRTLRDLDTLARTLPGSVHILASLNGEIRAQGNVTTVRQIHYARMGATTVAADRADTLATLMGADAGVREDLLARELLGPAIPYPLAEEPLWRGVERLPGDCYLELPSGGGHRTVRWWAPPEPELTLDEGAALLRSALIEAAAVRTQGGGTISADFSGGLDSTSLCFLIGDGGPAHLLANRWEATDPANDDGVWADQAALALPGAEYLVTSPGEMPSWYADMTVPVDDLEAPVPWLRTHAQHIAQVRLVAGHGATRHVTGHGGDELFATFPTYLHALVRTGDPLNALRHVRATAAMMRWKHRSAARALLDSRSYGRWLTDSASSLTAAPAPTSQPRLPWGNEVRMPPWAEREAVEAARRMYRAAAAAQPFAAQRGQHRALELARICGGTIRRVDRLSRRHGVSWHAPYVDDRVVEAALSINLSDRAATFPYKPSLTAAMRGIVPDHILGRRTKAEFSAEAYAGLRRHKRELAELCDDLRLARLGLVNPGKLRAALLGIHPTPHSLVPLDHTLTCEAWLRSLPDRESAFVSPGGPR
ncbi:asparagine synthase-related protein [Streptomyces sp. NPDC097640]|uniref:asparagine synthase-related protein n=1 Tax=Streptomyces sp. NPDC097640 TaxID=3157229 RepID=UPI00331B14B5